MRADDAGACPRCGGRVTATHMLLRTYPLDASGQWQRRLADFAEDILVACSACGHQPAGGVHHCADRFRFVPAGVP